MTEPGIQLTVVHAERNGAVKGVGWILAEEIVRGGVRHFDRAVLDGVEDGRAGNDFACGENLDLELAAGGLGHHLGHVLGTAVNRIKALRKAGRQPPFDRWCILGDCGHGDSAGSKADTRFFQKGTSFHFYVSSRVGLRIAQPV